ncbi:ABC transporter ATP-binding protein [Bradyrhizobium sp. McL0615]|uniref:ABC transporter ATP-binding protein n=1 Tax=Bradyrhizobium sp. McL0615 TaxID=3415673 RepID=UPI003CEF3E59
MSDVAIAVENLSKSYLIGHQTGSREQYTALRDVIAREARNFVRKGLDFIGGRAIVQGDEVEEFWALRDVSFEVKRGEVLGIIGRNGAGKSTLLKILSRITEPDRGRAVVRGRIASLLEVGTGFHPELTGRENIFLNGAILGMTRTEIRRKFDEIVDFAEVERFLDTPVKRYSSGMYVRLAFAVAAHLEPEILIIDEVLAVGDASFQKKSLGKMHSVANKEKRTVLFVSHNLQAVQSLCDRAILLNSGTVETCGPSRAVVGQYLRRAQSPGGEKVWPEHAAPGNDALSLLAVRIINDGGEVCRSVDTDKDFFIEFEFIARKLDKSLCVGFDLANSDGATILRTYQTDSQEENWPSVRVGRNRWRCKIPRGLLNGGNYLVHARISIHNVSWIVHEDAILEFCVNLRHGISPFWSLEDNRPGLMAPILNWT